MRAYPALHPLAGLRRNDGPQGPAGRLLLGVVTCEAQRGAIAKRLCPGLQIRLGRFDSASRLHPPPSTRDDTDRQQKVCARRHVMAAFASGLDEFDSLYRDLAK